MQYSYVITNPRWQMATKMKLLCRHISVKMIWLCSNLVH